jgi:mono/diheme cytochrome c family protein
VGKESKPTAAAAPAPAAAPAGHTGAGLPPGEFGDPVKGKALFASKRCADCHSYDGQGGKDAPPLDYMRGHLSAREIANMSGNIWNHLPMMLPHFKEEGIPFPTFSDDEMADLIAYLHSAPPASAR